MLHTYRVVLFSSDPLPPTGLTVSPTTTTSVKVQWQYDSTKSFCVKWKVKYTVKDMNNFQEVFTSVATDLEKTIDNLTPGKTYTIQVFGVTTNGVVSKTDVHDDVTLCKYRLMAQLNRTLV